MAHHVTPIRDYLLVFLALMVLTAITVAVAFVDLGAWNDIVAMSIALLKATLVVLIFMHVRYSARLSKVSVVSGVLWLIILIGLTLSDYMTRGFIQ
jgi:cytochrome c oxidase subunit 4